jgi:hypothetical protein
VPLTDTQLEQYMTGDGWPVKRIDDTTWRSLFTVGEQRFDFFVRLTPSWVFFTIIPFAPLPAEPKQLLALYQRVLELNQTITLAKFGIQRNEGATLGPELVLTVELPTEHLVESQFKDGLDALSFYAGTHHAEVSKLAGAAN